MLYGPSPESASGDPAMNDNGLKFLHIGEGAQRRAIGESGGLFEPLQQRRQV